MPVSQRVKVAKKLIVEFWWLLVLIFFLIATVGGPLSAVFAVLWWMFHDSK